MLIFGELNVFSPTDAKTILRKTHQALRPGGALLIEPHTFDAVEQLGRQPRSWHSAKEGLFSDKSHLCLQENSWDPNDRTATTRYYIIDVDTGDVTRHAASYQAYTDAEYGSLLGECGFSNLRQYGSLTGTEEDGQRQLIAIVARK